MNLFTTFGLPKKTTMKKCPVCERNNEVRGTLSFLEVDTVKPLFIEYYVCECLFMFYRYDDIMKTYKENNKYVAMNTGSGTNIKYDIKRLNQTYSNVGEYLKNEMSLLDVGCNNGTFLKILSSNNSTLKLYGTDIEIGENNKRDLVNTGFHVLETLNLEDFNKKFDFITVIQVLEHVDDILNFINQFKSVLLPIGKLYIEVPDADKYIDNYFQPYSFFDLEHINHFNLDNLSSLFRQNGYSILDKYSFDVEVSEQIKYPAIGIMLEKAEVMTHSSPMAELKKNSSLYDYIKKSNSELNNYIYKDNFDGKVLFGVGANTLRTLGLLNKDISKVKYFVDNNPIFHERMVNNIIIKNSNYLLNDKDVPDVVIFSKLYFDEIKTDLLAKGFKGNIYNFF